MIENSGTSLEVRAHVQGLREVVAHITAAQNDLLARNRDLFAAVQEVQRSLDRDRIALRNASDDAKQALRQNEEVKHEVEKLQHIVDQLIGPIQPIVTVAAEQARIEADRVQVAGEKATLTWQVKVLLAILGAVATYGGYEILDNLKEVFTP